MEDHIALSNSPEYFGSFLNLARLNIFSINNHLALKFGIKPLEEESHLSNSFLVDERNSEFIKNESKIFSQLKRYMPIVKIFDDELLPQVEIEKLATKSGKDFKGLKTSLGVVFRELNVFRNDYTHHYSKALKDERKVTISNELKTVLERCYQLGILYTKQRFKDVFVEKDYELATKTILVNEDNSITVDGIVFLTTLFLDRENAFSFINKIRGFKGTINNSFKARREVLCAYCVNLPHEKFISEDAKQSFSLEIINELNKCPKILYNSITDEAKKPFHPELGETEIENIAENSLPDGIEDFQAYIESISKKMRNENRFHYFELKFIDTTNVFEKIRFQINLGKIILDEYEKPLNDINEKRRVVERAMAFGKLQNFIDEKEVLKKVNTGAIKASFEQFTPHYNFDNNKIGITVSKEDTAKLIPKSDISKKVKTTLKQPVVDAFLSTHELSKIIVLNYLSKGKPEQLINDFITISNSKLFTMEFIEEIKSKLTDFDVFEKRSRGRKQTDGAYKEGKLKHLRYRKEKLNAVLSEYNLNVKQIPTRILEYWLNIKDVDQKTTVSERIKLMKRDCIDRLKALKKDKAPKIGEMATFLAKDIVDMIIDVDKKKKITSFYYDKMQQCLALYADSEKKKQFIQIIKELGMNENGGHPFLNKIVFENYRYTADIYKTYLEEKGQKLVQVFNPKTGKNTSKDYSWLEVTFYKKELNEAKGKQMTVVKLPDNLSKLPYTIVQFAKKKSSFENWHYAVTKGIGNDRKKPIDLPTNLFDEALKHELTKVLIGKNILFEETATYSELFKIWWDKIREDSVQDFYASQREYLFEDCTLHFMPNTKNKFKEYWDKAFIEKVKNAKQTRINTEKLLPQNKGKKYEPIKYSDVEKSLSKKIGSTEREIRIQEEEDRIMLLMFEQLLDNKVMSKLKSIQQLLNETIEVTEKIEGLLSFNSLGEHINDTTQKSKIAKHIFENRKRKDFSVLKKYSYDRRLPELFEYFSEERIDVAVLKKEIDSYNKSRDKVFNTFFKLEKAIIAKAEREILSLTDENNIPHKIYLQWLLEKEYITQKEYVFMNMVRNTFSHNQFPQKATIESYMTLSAGTEIAKQIEEQYQELVTHCITKIA